MAPQGKIVSIKIEQPTGPIQTMANSLAAKGRSRVPGTGIILTPKRESSNRYRTGIDETAPSILAIEDKEEREAEIARVKAMRERLQEKLGIDDLSATSKYWNYMLATPLDQNHVSPYKLKDGENIFSFADPMAELNFRWLSVHPLVAPSYETFQRGDAGPGVLFYVHDEEIENQRVNKTKKEINSAVIKLENSSPDKRKKVAKLLGLPVSDNSREDLVYNLLDTLLKQTEFKDGQYKGLSTVRMFNKFMDMQPTTFNAKVLVKEALDLNIYRKKDDGIYEGERKVANSEEALVNDLIDSKSQQFLIALEEKLKTKKLALA